MSRGKNIKENEQRSSIWFKFVGVSELYLDFKQKSAVKFKHYERKALFTYFYENNKCLGLVI